MIKTELAKPTRPETVLSLNMRGVNDFFPGFSEGDFAVIHGSSSAETLASMLCLTAQLSKQLGGLDTNVIFVDGGNTFDIYQISKLSRLLLLDPREVLNRIFISRAFTAYQETALIMQKLKLTINRFQAKVVVISDIAGFFLDKDLSEDEARRVFSQVVGYLSNVARENKIVLIATVLPHSMEQKRADNLDSLICDRANIVLSLKRTKNARVFSLEKHPCRESGSVELPSNITTLTDFMEVD